MYQNKKFEKAAKNRKYFAFMAAVVLHLAVIAAVSSGTDLKELVPGFIKEMFVNEPALGPDAPRP